MRAFMAEMIKNRLINTSNDSLLKQKLIGVLYSMLVNIMNKMGNFEKKTKNFKMVWRLLAKMFYICRENIKCRKKIEIMDFQNIDSLNTLIGGIGIAGIIAFLVILLIIHVLLCLVPFFMARSRGRSGLLWLIISFFVGWFWTIVILLIVGDSTDKQLRSF